MILDGDSFRGVLYAPGARGIARASLFYTKLVTGRRTGMRSASAFLLLTHMPCVSCVARDTLEKKDTIGQMLALIAKVVFFHRQRLVALNLVFRAGCRSKKEEGSILKKKIYCVEPSRSGVFAIFS